MLSVSQPDKLLVCSFGQAVGLCCRSVSLSSCWSVVSIMLWVCAIGQSVGLAVGLCPAM